MRVSWIKYEKDNKSFTFAEKLGLNVYKINNPELIDEKIKELIKKDYRTIILSNEISGFSQDIIKKYNKQKDINIIITPNRQT